MKKLKFSAACLILSGSIICSSCIGSFGLWSSLKDWNNNIGNKFVNEIVFLAFHIVPVYEVAYLADVIVLNSIEFWSGSNQKLFGVRSSYYIIKLIYLCVNHLSI
jgi:hypothetical protein